MFLLPNRFMHGLMGTYIFRNEITTSIRDTELRSSDRKKTKHLLHLKAFRVSELKSILQDLLTSTGRTEF